jgi:hypothetical protein
MRDHISHTQIAMLLRCGEEYRRTYVEGQPRPLAPALIVGQVYHKAIEFGFRARLTDGAELSPSEIRQVAQDAWAMAVAGQEICWDGESPETLCTQAANLAELYWSEVAPDISASEIEARFEVEVPAVDVPLVGIIDLVDGDTLVDHKTARRAWSKARADRDLQAASYLYARLQQTGDLPGKFRFDVAVKGGKPRIQQLGTSRTERQLLRYEQLLQAAWGQIQAGIFVPNPTGWNCSPRYCPFWDDCQG